MIAPESAAGSKWQTARTTLLWHNLLVSAFIFLVLEIWRPCFFLTDDNLSGGFPFFTEMGHRLWRGQSPFVCDYLFGGHYNLLRDATFFCWHPVYLLSSLLAATPLHFWIVDVSAFAFLMLATSGFVNLAWYLRRDLKLSLSDGWIMFFTMSYTYSVLSMALGSSWLNYLANESALPWLTLGIVQRNWRAGFALVTLFSLHQLLGGHLLATISNTLFLSIFAIGFSFCRQSWVPFLNWAAGYALALFIILPLFLPIVDGFLHTTRAQGVPLEEMQLNNIPFAVFPLSLFLGMALWFGHQVPHAHITYTAAFGACAAAWCILPTLTGRARWRGLDYLLIGIILFAIVMVCRPLWITIVMSHLPLMKSMRYPFRELLQFLFFFHLFLVVHRSGQSHRVRRLFALFGTSLLVLPLFLNPLPPTLNAMPVNRQLLFSGDFDRYWAQVRTHLQPTDRIAVVIPLDLYLEDTIERPSSLLGTYNYAILAHVINVAGYSNTAPIDQKYLHLKPSLPNGSFEPDQLPELWKERPEIRVITLESVDPVRITLRTSDGQLTDLTPYIPK